MSVKKQQNRKKQQIVYIKKKQQQRWQTITITTLHLIWTVRVNKAIDSTSDSDWQEKGNKRKMIVY